MLLQKDFSQSVSINTTGNVADTSAMLDITSAAKGILIPRMTQAQKLAIFSPADGLLVYQIDVTKGFYFYNTISGWTFLTQGSGGIASLNGLTASAQTFSTPGTIGTSPNWISSGSAHTLNIPIASSPAVNAGLISNANWNTFNNKVGSIILNTSGVLYPSTNTFSIAAGGAATGTLTLNTQAINTFLAGPSTGADATPVFRTIVPGDLPKATTTTVGAVSVGSGLTVTAGGVLNATNTNGGTLTSASVVTANGLAGTVANATTTPAITLSTMVTGIVKGNGTALFAATSGTDYAPGTAGNTTGIVKSTTGTGALTTAVAADFPILNQNTTGTASNITGILSAASHPALTGDVTNTAGTVATIISNGVVSNAKLATMPANTFKANNTLGAASPSDITGTQATALLDVFTSTAKGLVPASGGGTTGFLRADGTFAVPSGTNAGTVTSVSVTPSNGVSGTVATATTIPAITLTLGAITPSSVAAAGTVTGSNLSGTHSGTSSGTNTGDETTATIKTKLGAATATTDGYLTLADWNTFNNKASASNVISSLNGLTATTQTFATPGTAGTAPAWSSSGSSHTLNIPLASAAGVTAGLLSNTDFTTFNNKVGSISLTGDGVIHPSTTFTVTNGAASGTLGLNTQSANRFLAGPATGANAQPTFRAIVPADLPVATTTTLGAVSVGSGLSVTAGGILSATNTNGGTVTSASVATANGLAGTVANATTTPAITLSTTVTGMVKGNGTALSTATSGTDYAPGTAANTTGIVKSTTGTGALTTAVASDFPVLNQNTTGIASNITGVLNATSHPALTGDVTNTAGTVATTISNGVVSNAKLATMPANTFKANNTAGIAVPSDITGTQATTLLDVFTPTLKGLVPASGGGTIGFLRADGTFAVPSGTNAGTVTSVSVAFANGVSGTVSTPNTTPAITLTLGAITPSSVAATSTVTGSNLSGTNTGDETTATIKTKLGSATSTTDGYLTLADWNSFNNKATATGTWSTTGNTGTNSGSNFLGTTDNTSLRFRTLNTQRIIIDSIGNVGIGITNPLYKLQVFSASNPLYLNGVQTGTNTSSDSILTITNGVIKKIPSTTYISSGSGTSIQSIIKSSVTVTDNTALSQSSSRSISVAVTGAALNASVIVNPRSALPSTVGIGYAFVSSAGNLTINFIVTGPGNTTLGTLNLDISIIQ